MALDCLNDYVGLRGCTDLDATQFDLGSLPGISTGIIEAVTDKERESWVQTLADTKALAAPEFKALVGQTIQEIRPIYQTCGCDTCDTDTIICDSPDDFKAAYAYFLAIQIGQRRLTTDRFNGYTSNPEKIGMLIEIYLEKLTILLKEAIRNMDLSTCCGGTNVASIVKINTALP